MSPKSETDPIPSILHQRRSLCSHLRTLQTQAQAGDLDGARVVVTHESRPLLDMRSRNEREERVVRAQLWLIVGTARLAERRTDPQDALRQVQEMVAELALALGFQSPAQARSMLEAWETQRQG
jgi:hypothetical protein